MESAKLQDQGAQATDGAMVEPEIVRQMRALDEFGWGTRRIARELGVNRATVKRYLRGGPHGRRRAAAMRAVFLADALACGLLTLAGQADDRTRVHLFGTLGGFGLPGGPKPWLSEVPQRLPRLRAALSPLRRAIARG